MKRLSRHICGGLGALLLCASASPAIVGFSLDCTLSADTCRDCPGDPGSGNGAVDPGERVNFELTLTNVGDEDTTSIGALVDSAASGLFCQPDFLDFGDLLVGEVSAPVPSPDCTLEESVACGETRDLVLQVTTDQGDTTTTCQVTVPAFCDTCCGTAFPGLESCSVATDVCPTGGGGSGDGALDPGETADVSVVLTNEGNQRTRSVRARVASPTPGARVLQGETQYDTILFPDSEAGDPPVSLFVDEFVSPGAPITLNVAIDEQDEGGVWRQVNQESCSVSVADPATVCLPDTAPGEVTGVRVRRAAEDIVLSWVEAAEATRYAVHEGELAAPPPPWQHAVLPAHCLVPYPPTTTLGGAIGDERALYYLIQGRNGFADGGLGEVDLDADGVPETPRPADLTPCN